MAFQEIEHILHFLKHYASFPSVSCDTAYEQGMCDTRRYISQFLKQESFDVQEISTPKHPILLASYSKSPQAPSLLLYGHYDVQPPEPLELWQSSPFTPTIRDDILYGRGIADNKGAHTILLHALCQTLHKNPSFPWNIRVLFEGEEEIGSPSMKGFLKEYGDSIRSDLFLLSDTWTCDEEHLSLTTGLRGLVTLECEISTATLDLHSGMGGPMPNAAQVLAEICAQLHDAQGKVLVEDFYRDVQKPSAEELASLQLCPLSEDAIRRDTGIEHFAPHEHSVLYAQKFLPTLEINGIHSGWEGQGVKTIIPAKAKAKISCRLVPNQSPEHISQQLSSRLRQLCPPWAHMHIASIPQGKAYSFPLEDSQDKHSSHPRLSQAFHMLQAATRIIMGTPLLLMREGGSIPFISTIQELTGMNPLMLGFFTQQNQLHAPNENLSLQMIDRVYRVFCRFFEQLSNMES
ncbi:MAG: M20/M25/M40 family metallo-hydrolase [Puniceicoccales bacterium]|jgi:acetylornithine deacetylase/succinyl-diaminopimelate desuccinylase-like protein|nr:M20/M25/M40 family metallo-hydrolase [Puniceicoccales bacterium]